MIKDENTKCSDQLELYRIDGEGSWTLGGSTDSNIEGVCSLGDAFTNYGIADFATYISDKYDYGRVGTDGTSGSDYTLTDLKAPIMSRVAFTKSFDTTYVTNDTAIFTAITTSTGDYTLAEFGIHDASSGGNMGARQTGSWSVVDGETFGIIWRIVVSRG